MKTPLQGILMCFTSACLASAGALPPSTDNLQNPAPCIKDSLSTEDTDVPDDGVEQYIIPDVPAYVWYHGAAPTAAGSIIGYLDRHGYPGLIPGGTAPIISEEGDFAHQAIASDQHYEDYALPIDSGEATIADKSQTGNAHAHDCVADFMGTSFSSLDQSYGSTDTNTLIRGLAKYFVYQYPELNVDWIHAPVTTQSLHDTFELTKLFIRSNIPVMATVNSEEGFADHMVCIVGYRHDPQTGLRHYIAYNGYDQHLHGYSFLPAWNHLGGGSYSKTHEANRVARIHAINPGLNLLRQPVYCFYQSDTGSYFFTANELEKQALEASANSQLLGISYRAFAEPVGTSMLPVYRFVNPMGGHFYTVNEGEKDAIIASMSHLYTLDGIAFYVLSGPLEGARPVYRFFQPSTLSHFFTIDGTEKDRLILENTTLNYEGIAWYAFAD